MAAIGISELAYPPSIASEVAANHRFSKRAFNAGFIGKDAKREGRQAEVARYLRIKTLDPVFTKDVCLLRKRYEDEWNKIPKWQQLPGTDWESPLSKEVDVLCIKHGIDSIIVHRRRFLPNIRRPYPARPLIGGPLGGRWGHRSKLQRIDRFEDYLDLFVDWEVLKDMSVPPNLTEASCERILSRFKQIVLDVAGSSPRSSDRSPGPKHQRRRLFPRDSWYDDSLEKIT